MFPGIAPYGKALYTGSRNEWFFEVIGDVLHHIWFEVFNNDLLYKMVKPFYPKYFAVLFSLFL
jgi:hypothetical protein